MDRLVERATPSVRNAAGCFQQSRSLRQSCGPLTMQAHGRRAKVSPQIPTASLFYSLLRNEANPAKSPPYKASSRFLIYSLAGLVFPLRVSFQLRAVEVNFSKPSRTVPFRLVIEVRRRCTSALTSSSHRSRPNPVAEFDDRNEAVAACSIPSLRSRICACSEGGQRAPKTRCKTN